MVDPVNNSRILSVSGNDKCLDPVQLETLERSFRSWANSPKRHDHQLSRHRILMIFLIIRYSAARLSEVFGMSLRESFDFKKHRVKLCKEGPDGQLACREIPIPETVSQEIKKILAGQNFVIDEDVLFNIDPSHIRRKFYERSMACGFPKELASPDLIRKSRAVELMQSNMPLPVVQNILGHSTPNLAASYVAFSDEDIHEVAKYYLEKESQRKTSARNTFFGKVSAILQGNIQAKVELTTISGQIVTTVITIDSLARLGIKIGSLITAEVKAPWVILQKRHESKPKCTAENLFHGTIERIKKGKVITEYIVRISKNMEICSIVTSESDRKLNLKESDQVWAMFNSFSIVLHAN